MIHTINNWLKQFENGNVMEYPIISNEYRKRPGLVKMEEHRKLVSEIAYYLWLNGSQDEKQNWIDAEIQALESYKEQ
jgi:hypothetical protein